MSQRSIATYVALTLLSLFLVSILDAQIADKAADNWHQWRRPNGVGCFRNGQASAGLERTEKHPMESAHRRAGKRVSDRLDGSSFCVNRHQNRQSRRISS